MRLTNLEGTAVGEGEWPWLASSVLVDGVQVEGGVFLRLTPGQEGDTWWKIFWKLKKILILEQSLGGINVFHFFLCLRELKKMCNKDTYSIHHTAQTETKRCYNVFKWIHTPATAAGTVLLRAVTVALAISAAVYFLVHCWPAVTMLGLSRVPSRKTLWSARALYWKART